MGRSAAGRKGLTSQVEEVVVLQAVHGLELAADVELLGRVEQVPDGRVLLISAEHLLGLEGSVFPCVSACCCCAIAQRNDVCEAGWVRAFCAHLFGL